jgi:hypothetical protein
VIYAKLKFVMMHDDLTYIHGSIQNAPVSDLAPDWYCSNSPQRTVTQDVEVAFYSEHEGGLGGLFKTNDQIREFQRTV